MKLNNSDLLKFALNFADESKKILQKNYFKTFNIEEKNDGSLVTNIDKEIEEKFRKLLKKKFPEHGVIGECVGGQHPQQHQRVHDQTDDQEGPGQQEKARGPGSFYPAIEHHGRHYHADCGNISGCLQAEEPVCGQAQQGNGQAHHHHGMEKRIDIAAVMLGFNKVFDEQQAINGGEAGTYLSDIFVNRR